MTHSPVRSHESLFKILQPNVMPTLDAVLKAVKAADNSGKLDLGGSMIWSDSILKCETLSFGDESVLMLTAMEADFIAVAAEQIILDIRNPNFRAFISRPIGSEEQKILVALNGATGQNGARGADGQGEVDFRGNDGSRGSDGGRGGDGKTLQLPPLFLFTQALIFGNGATPDRRNLGFFYDGFQGGDAGTGGNGGDGGGGAPGKTASSGLFDCRHGAGNGGTGGGNGAGGHGGDAGAGGDGGWIFLLAPDAHLFDFTTGSFEPGKAGNYGPPGQPGNPGKGGDPGAPAGLCSGGGLPGHRGQAAIPATLGPGDPAPDGTRGRQVVQVRDNSDLFA